MRRKRTYRSLLLCGALAAVSGVGAGSAVAAQDPADQAVELEDVLVTARRREESLQTVPVSVQAVTAETLVERHIESTIDLQRIVPGVIFSGAGSDVSTTFSIRGQGKFVTGPGTPSVITYMNEVPLTSWGSIMPTFDVANVQILKGPQGTLFGRNTTGGAVLVYSQRPTNDFSGYIQGTLGRYSWRGLEGAINLPIVDDRVLLRVAGEYVKRDGYTKEANGFGDLDDRDSRAFRVSLLLRPADGITNTTVFDHYSAHTHGPGTSAIGFTPFPLYKFGAAAFGPVLGPLIDAGFNCTTSINCNLDQQVLRQQAAGPRRVWSDIPQREDSKIWGLSNTTEINLGSVTIKNILGLREVDLYGHTNVDGAAVALVNTEFYQNVRQVSEELQISGEALNDRLTYVLGGFYVKSKPTGPGGLSIDLLRPAFIPVNPGTLGSNANEVYSDRSNALFANLSYEITENLKVNAGYRYTWDKVGVCSAVQVPTTLPMLDGLDACRAAPGHFELSTKFSAPTWNLGLDYQLSDQVFTYVAVRRGYRTGHINSPRLGGRLVSFQTYNPQYITDVEIGLKADWSISDVRGRTNIALYRGNFKDLQRALTSLPPNFDGDGNPLNDPANTTLTINSGKARFQGVEIDGSIIPTPSLRITYAGSYLDSKATDNTLPALFTPLGVGATTFDNAPKWSYSLSGQWTLPIDLSGASLKLNADYYWVSKYVVGTMRFPSHGVANASIDVTDIGERDLTVSAFVTNVFDKVYLHNGNLTGDGLGIHSGNYGEPRMYGVRARLGF